MSGLLMKLTHRGSEDFALIAPAQFDSATMTENGKTTMVHTKAGSFSVSESMAQVAAEYERAVEAMLMLSAKTSFGAAKTYIDQQNAA